MTVNQIPTSPPPVYDAIGTDGGYVFDQAPQLVYWESTQACDLACIHCRASATTLRHPLELDTAEARDLLCQIAAFADGPSAYPQARRKPHLVITGGDPLQRPDLFELIAFARSLGLPVSITPAGTPRLTQATLQRLQQAGINALGLSLDGSSPQRHDAFRGERGSFDWTIYGLRLAREMGLPVQVNTMVTAETIDDLPAIYDAISDLGIARWAVFFLIATGRGENLQSITAAASERFLNWLWRLAADAPFPIKTTEAHHYRRIAYLKMRKQGLSAAGIAHTPTARGFGIRDGNGILFISHTGAVYPSGFLPLSAGNVRRHNLVDLYRNSALFRSLRDVDQLKGKCGRCEFRAICGGSRARAYATHADPLASDDLCPYEPRAR